MYVCIYASMYVCMCVCMYICMYVCMYVCIYVCIYVLMYVCMHVCCVDIHSLMDGLEDRQYITHADGRKCLGVRIRRFRERECSLGPRGHGAQVAKRHTKQVRMVAEPSVSDLGSC